ncbi:hypothetical protein C7441_11018 [Pseudaminobacter salicylatoxidans]|uniref:Uncharacterized protein n=1 Tax=Pseudaminobacter salicylatoxidans TaxID=93369 RepID=A0A316C0E8_PSESE|nr:hypothetical protein [Pseudaminobacter salicylatoxidans]PWJ81486.1 hypothetical protein C7441_11018 [Pseudaminobacter salicylatoxidans]
MVGIVNNINNLACNHFGDKEKADIRGERTTKPAVSSGVALVLGSAEGVWQEIAAAQAMHRFDAVIAVNDMVIFWTGPLDAAVSLHPERMPEWLEYRAARRNSPPVKLVTHAEWPDWFKVVGHIHELPIPFDIVTPSMFEGQKDSGSSGLFAVKAALQDLGFAKVVLCGVPMTVEAGHFRSPSLPWVGALRHRVGWEQALPHLTDCVRSMSGWTAELLGKPTKSWLDTA